MECAPEALCVESLRKEHAGVLEGQQGGEAGGWPEGRNTAHLAADAGEYLFFPLHKDLSFLISHTK